MLALSAQVVRTLPPCGKNYEDGREYMYLSAVDAVRDGHTHLGFPAGKIEHHKFKTSIRFRYILVYPAKKMSWPSVE